MAAGAKQSNDSSSGGGRPRGSSTRASEGGGVGERGRGDSLSSLSNPLLAGGNNPASGVNNNPQCSPKEEAERHQRVAGRAVHL